jgi:hypothetical protein
MAKNPKRCIRSSKASRSKPPVPEAEKRDVKEKAAELVESVLKPMHIKPPPKGPRFNLNYS